MGAEALERETSKLQRRAADAQTALDSEQHALLLLQEQHRQTELQASRATALLAQQRDAFAACGREEAAAKQAIDELLSRCQLEKAPVLARIVALKERQSVAADWRAKDAALQAELETLERERMRLEAAINERHQLPHSLAAPAGAPMAAARGKHALPVPPPPLPSAQRARVVRKGGTATKRGADEDDDGAMLW